MIAGAIGPGSLGYAAIGEQVGMAQRMESVAPPGGVMLSESTAQLVEHTATLGEPEGVRIKGADEPVRVRRLVGIGRRDGQFGRVEASLVGRPREMAALEEMVDRTIGGRGGVVTVSGAPGIGKSRVAREAAAHAAARGVDVVWTFCESHAGDVPFHTVKRLLRAVSGIEELDGPAARERLRARLPDADPQDLLLLDDLMGIADPEVPLPQIDPDARRRRLTALINDAALARTTPALFIIEDAHWIDAVSESMLADFLPALSRTSSLVVITARPEYQGALTRVHGTELTMSLAPLADSDTAALVADLLGTDPSVGELATIIADRAAGNPFFAEEMVRELAQRGVLTGEHGDYRCRADVADVSVPATVQAAIEARIDRLTTPAKRMLSAASVIGVHFGAELLSALGIDEAFEELLDAELIDEVRLTPSGEYAFRHPLIRAVAYESQLRSDRAEWHRLLATAIQQREGGSEQDAALIAEHLQAAGELRAAYGWHMRAGAWSTERDLGAARVSWERARRIADALPSDDPDRLAMRIGPRAMLCGTDYQDRAFQDRRGRFAELRELCSTAGDKVSLAIGMTGLATELLYAGRARECSRLASEQVTLLEAIGDADVTVGLAPVAFAAWADTCEFDKILRWSQVIVDLAAGDPAKGAAFGLRSPLTIALTWRGFAQAWLGRPGWRRDLDDAVAMARRSSPTTLAAVALWGWGVAVHYGVIRADDSSLRILEEAVRSAEGASHDVALSGAEYALAGALLYRDAAADRHRGLQLIVQAREFWLRQQICLQMVPNTELWVAREEGPRGHRDASLAIMRDAVDGMYRTGRLAHAVWGVGVLVEALLERGTEGDVAEAQHEIGRLASLRADHESAMVDITLLRLRALLARACGDEVACRTSVNRYRDMALSLGFEGHMDWAEALV